MKSKGPLMVEHRVIEHIVKLVKKELESITAGSDPDPKLIYHMVGFFRNYADKMHHGKEEDILFKRLLEKDLEEKDRKSLNKLIEEHKIAREMIGLLNKSAKKFESGDTEAKEKIRSTLEVLFNLYTRHIHDEDCAFFPQTEKYLSDEEQDEIMREFYKFDADFVHKDYLEEVKEMEGEGPELNKSSD